MYKYTFTDGTEITSKLQIEEVIKRSERLSWLIVLTEGYDDGEGLKIHDKAVKAYNKVKNFTGIIRLSSIEKEFLSYIFYENKMLCNRDIETLKYYVEGNK